MSEMSDSLSVDKTVQQEARRMWWFVLIGTIVGAGVIAFLPVTYAEADDLGVQMILAGADGFSPAAEVPFLSFFMNQLLLQLYQLIPGISWYGLLLVLTQTSGLSLLGYCLLRKLRETPWLGMVFPFFVIFGFFTLLTVTFTQAALTLMFAVAIAIGSRDGKAGWPTSTRIGLALLLLWALFWRWKFGLYCLLFFLPLLIVQLGQMRQYVKLLAIVLCFMAVDRLAHTQYASPAWQDYMEFYNARAELFDMPGGRAGDNLDASLLAAGWSVEDYQLIRQTWMLYDERLTSTEAMQAFTKAVAESGGASIAEQIENNLRDNAQLLYAFIPIGFAVLLLGLKSWAVDPRWQKKTLALIMLVIPVLFLAYFRLVPRILVPIFLYGFSLLNLWAMPEERGEKRFSWKQNVTLTPLLLLTFIPVVIGLGSSFLVLNQQWEATQKKSASYTDVESFVAELNQPVTLLRTQVSALPGWEGVHPYQRLNPNQNLRVIPSGWQVGSPRYLRILNDLGYASGSEMLARFAQSAEDGEYFVQRFTNNRGMMELYSEDWLDYLKRHHTDRPLSNPELNVIAIGNLGHKLSLLKLMAESDEPLELDSLIPE